MTFPVSGLNASPVSLAALGLVVGVFGGAFGVGGSFIAGPALYLMGMPLPYVVGTDLAHIAGKSLVAARHHHALGHVDVKLALMFTPATLAGVELGARFLDHLKYSGHVDVVALAYAFLLVALAIFLFIEGRRASRLRRGERREGLLEKLHDRLGPWVNLHVSRIRSSVLAIGAIGLVTGFVGGLLGGGAGYIRMPALVFLLGVPTPIAVGTDLCEVVVSASYGAVTHALKGNVDFGVALAMQVGGVIGARAGARLTTMVRGATLRTAFAPLPLVGAILIIIRVCRGAVEP